MVNDNQCTAPAFRQCTANNGYIIQLDYANDETFFVQQSSHYMLEVGWSSINAKRHLCVGKMSIFHTES